LIANVKKADLSDGLVCISPAFTSKLKIPFLKVLHMFVSAFIQPQKEFSLPFDSKMCTRDVEMQEIMDSDPNESRVASASFLLKILIAQMKAKFLMRRFQGSVLFLSAGEDYFIYPKISKQIFDTIPSTDKSFINYPGMFHALSVDLGREKVFEDVNNWVNERL